MNLFTVVSNTEVRRRRRAPLKTGTTGEPDFQSEKGASANGQLYIDAKLVGGVDMPYTVRPIFSTEGLTCGHDRGRRVAPDDYHDGFAFTALCELLAGPNRAMTFCRAAVAAGER